MYIPTCAAKLDKEYSAYIQGRSKNNYMVQRVSRVLNCADELHVLISILFLWVLVICRG